MSERSFSVEVPNLINQADKKEESQRDLESILNRKLTVENVNSYADEALNSLIDFADKRVTNYKKNNQTVGLSDKEIEDSAFKFYGLGDINSTLDFISRKADEIHGLDKIIDLATKINSVIIKPDPSTEVNFNGNGGEFREKKIFDRLKTVLFVLKEDFDIDVNDRQKLMIQRGVVSDRMVRKTSYYLLNVFEINRTILVCDEEGNASYVFDSKLLNQKGIFNDKIANSTKSELNRLIEETPELGKRIVYSKDGFVPRMIDAIEKPVGLSVNEKIEEMEKKGNYLVQKAPDGYLSATGVAKKIGVSAASVYKVVEEMKNQFDRVAICRFGQITTAGYSPEQQQIIQKVLQDKGTLSKNPPEGYLSITGIAKGLGISGNLISENIKDIKDQIGEVNFYKFENKVTQGYSPEQQQIIEKYLKNKGALATKPPSGEILSILGMAEKFGISHSPVSEAVNEIGDQLGEVATYKFGPTTTFGYSPEQQQIIEKYLKEKGLFNEFSEDYLSRNAMAKKFNVDPRLVQLACKEIEDQLGEVAIHKVGGKTSVLSYSPEQQQIILTYLNKKTLEFNDYLSAYKMAENFNISDKYLSKVVGEIEDQLGEVSIYKSKGRNVSIYSPKQQEIIEKYLRNKGVFAEKAKDGYSTITSIANEMGINNNMVTRAIQDIGSQLGEVVTNRYRGITTLSYSPKQKELIIAQIEKYRRK